MAHKILRVCILGYHGYRNAGDDLLRSALEYIFSGHRIMETSWFPGVDVLNGSDLVVVGGGSIWPGSTIFQNGAEVARQLRPPLLVLGISAKGPDTYIRDQTKALLNKSALFIVRDRDTADILDLGNRVRIEPDLFWWMPWDPGFPTNASVGDAVALNLRDWSGAGWSPQAIVDRLQARGYRLKPIPFFYGDPANDPSATRNDVQIAADLGLKDIPISWTSGAFQQTRFSVAMRFHAVLVSIRTGRPVISFDYHPKVRAFFAEAGMPELCVPLQDLDSLDSALEKLEGNFHYYQKLTKQLGEKYLAAGADATKLVRSTVAKISESHDFQPSLSYRFLKSLLGRV